MTVALNDILKNTCCIQNKIAMYFVKEIFNFDKSPASSPTSHVLKIKKKVHDI